MSKAADAFKTISEVADDLDVPKHVLRFWENRFSQIKPMKRGGGRRYYRPADLELLRGIRHLLHNEGYTIKGVQKILREQGLDVVKTCWQPGQSLTQSKSSAEDRKSATKSKSRPGKAASKALKKGEKSAGALPKDKVIAALIAELESCRALLADSGSGPARKKSQRGKQKSTRSAKVA